MPERPLCAVIGAGPGVGLAVARRFAQAGFDLALFSRGGAAPEAAALRAEGHTVRAAALDAGDPASIQAALRAVGAVRVLIYNAAAVTQALPMALSAERLAGDLAVTVIGALAAAQAVAPGMRDGAGSSILFTGGGFAHKPIAALAALGMGKAALRNLAFSLADELRPAGIRVGTVTILGIVAPGTAFDPAAIAEAFYRLHLDRDYTSGVELGFTGVGHPTAAETNE